MTENTLAIQALYVAYFNRPADPRGLEYWEGVVAAQGGSTAAVSAEFSQSAEYKDLYKGMNNFDIVAQVYQNLFGRPGDLPGVNYWTKLLDNGSITIDNVVAQISAGAKGSDAETVENRAAGAAKFTEALDTVDEIRAYGTEAGGEVGRSFLAGITTDASLAAATSADALTTVTNQLLNSLPNTTTNLTAGIDNLSGTTGNDVFNAYASGVLANGDNATTLGSNDVIDGGAGNDTLNIETIAGFNTTQVGTVRNVETINIINNGAVFAQAAGVDASKFAGATAIWQIGEDVATINKVGTTTTAGFRNASTDAAALEVNAAGASVAVALDAVTGFTAAGATQNRVTLDVAGDTLNTVTVTGAVSKAVAAGAAAALDLNVTSGADAAGKSVSTVNVNTALNTTLSITKSGTGDVTTVNAAGSTGAVKYVGGANQSSITGGSAGDTLTLATAFAAAVKTATVNGGAGDDTITVAVDNTADVTGTKVTVDGGEGNDEIFVQVTQGATNATAVTVTGGAGNDIVHIQDDAGVYRALTDNDSITGGEGTDTIVLGSASATLDSGDYVRLQDLQGFEIVRFGNAVGTTAGEEVDASQLGSFTQIEFTQASNIVEVSAAQKLVAYADLTASTAGYNASASGDKNNSAAAADVTVKADATATVNAKSVALTVDTTEAEANVTATLAGDLDTATATLKSTTNGDASADYVASLEIAGAKFTSLTVSGTGSVTVDNSASTKLATINTSALAGTDVAGDEFKGLTFTGNIDLKETITLGTGADELTVFSKAGSTTFSLMDTITGFNLDVDTLKIDNNSTATEFVTKTFASGTLGAALNTVSALSDDAVVFSWGGDTYVFIEDSAGLTANGNFEATDVVVKLTGSYNLADLAEALTASSLGA